MTPRDSTNIQRQDGSNGLPAAANPGGFGNVPPNSAADARMTDRLLADAARLPERTVANTDLGGGDVIIGDDGSRSTVVEATESSAFPGFVLVTLGSGLKAIVDEDGESLLAATDERHFDFTADTITTRDFADVHALKDELGLAGTYMTEGDLKDIIVNVQEDDDDDFDVDEDEVIELIVNSDEWGDMGSIMSMAAQEPLETAARAAIEKLRAQAVISDEEMDLERRIQREGR